MDFLAVEAVCGFEFCWFSNYHLRLVHRLAFSAFELFVNKALENELLIFVSTPHDTVIDSQALNLPQFVTAKLQFITGKNISIDTFTHLCRLVVVVQNIGLHIPIGFGIFIAQL
jgi:hypothetical protein